MLLTADPTKAIKEPYQMVTVNYFPTSVQRLYRIGTTGDWLYYNDQAIKVNQGETIYTKGIDAYENETRKVSSYTSNVIDAILKEAYDGNDSTSEIRNNVDLYMQVDSSMGGKNIRFKGSVMYAPISLTFLNENKTEISSISRGSSVDEICTIPVGTYPYSAALYEIQPK
ncbi:MAG: hypothetical protein K0R72_1195 [Clostridia bacterium]|nr:hypothetical protein [Clostridia bacterium]